MATPHILLPLTEEKQLHELIKFYEREIRKYSCIYNGLISEIAIQVNGTMSGDYFAFTLFPESQAGSDYQAIYFKDFANNLGAYFSSLKMQAQDRLREIQSNTSDEGVR